MTEHFDPRSYLQTEARILAYDDVYVAIAVRFERAMISQYLPFMARLSDITPATVKNDELI